MSPDRLLKIANFFYALASEEKLPASSKDLKTILENIDSLETYNARKKYAEENLEHLSSGSSRIVYLSPDKTVIKMAQNDKGIAQNKAESNPKMISKYINKIISKSKDFNWIETYFLDKITEKEFEDMTGISFKDFGKAISYGLKNISGNSSEKEPDNFDKVKDSEIYKDLVAVSKKCKLLPGDIERISSFGKKDDHPILIDAGLTEEVYDDYYDDNSSS